MVFRWHGLHGSENGFHSPDGVPTISAGPDTIDLTIVHQVPIKPNRIICETLLPYNRTMRMFDAIPTL